MATAKRYADYPEEYSSLLRRAMDKPILIPFPNKLQARQFRNHLYAFRESIRHGTEAESIPDDLIITAPLISFKIDGNALLIHHPKRPSNIRKALENVRERETSGRTG